MNSVTYILNCIFLVLKLFPIRNKEGQRGKLVSTVERNRHTPKVSVLQRRQSASSVGRKGITVPCANQRVKMRVLKSYKSSVQQLLSAWTAY